MPQPLTLQESIKEPADKLYQSLVKFINDHYWDRRTALTTYWDFWKGDQKKYMPIYEGESDLEYSSRLKRAAIENHCKSTVNINSAYMYGMSDEIARIAKNEQLNKLLHDDVYYYNDMATLMMDARLMAGVTGLSIIEVTIYNKATRRPFKPGEKRTKDNFCIHYKLEDSTITIPLPSLNDRRELGSVIRYYELDDIDQYEALGVDYRKDSEAWILEYVTDDLWLRWLHYKDEQLKSELLPVFDGNNPNINSYGDVRIPFVTFRNIGDPMTIEGESDLEDAIPLQINLNERMTDDAIVISYHAMPLIKMMKGAKLPENFVRKPNSVLEIDGDGDMDYVTWEDKMEASAQYKSDVRASLAQATQVSQLSRGNMTGAGQLKTGMGAKTLFISDIIGVRIRRPYMIKGEKDLIYSTAKLYEKFGQMDFGNDYRCQIIMPEDFLGIDEYTDIQTENLKIQSGIPIDEEIKQMYPELTDKERKEIQTKIMERRNLNKPQPKPAAPGIQKQMEQ